MFVRHRATAAAGGCGPVHMAVRFPTAPRPTMAVCGEDITKARTVGSPFRGMMTVLCEGCGEFLEREG
jgi:hypothetical protein